MPRLTTRDYKRPSRASSAAKLKEFGLGVLVGAALASAAFLIAGAHARHRAAATAHGRTGVSSQDSAPHAPAAEDAGTSAADTGSTAPASRATPAQAGTPVTNYDFYRMLPRFKVPVQHDDERASGAAQPAPTPQVRTVGPGPSYLLQVGSYRSAAEADQVRARLARAGIDAQVQRVVEGSRTWNRVRIGPVDQTQLAKVRGQLQTANIHALVIRAGR